MSDYTITTDFSVKDALPDSDPEKIILGADVDVELLALQTAVNSKYDSTDIATQVQAEAGTNNATLMTPLRVAQYVLGGAGAAGIVGDILELTDPGADRILFWDDSAGAAGFLTAGTGLSISGTTISASAGGVDHDALLNFVANEHVDHTAVVITAGSGLSYSVGGTDISASATIDLDFNGLTTETVIDGTADFVAFYDTSAGAMRKVLSDALVGDALGDAKFYRNATQSIGSTESTIVWNTTDYNELTRGTFSTVTGEYTVGTAAARIWIQANTFISAQAAAEDATLTIEVDGVDKAIEIKTNRGKFGASGSSISVGTCLSLGAGAVVRVRIHNDGTKDLAAGIAYTNLNIIELA